MRSKLAQGTDDANDARDGRNSSPQPPALAAASDYRGLLSELLQADRGSSAEARERTAGRVGSEQVAGAERVGAEQKRRDILRLAPTLAANRTLKERPQAILAEADPLTGLLHRPELIKRLAGLLESKTVDVALGLLWIDLHRFKTINDRFGYRVGDRALKEVAQRLLTMTGELDLVARLGGDEFAILRPRAESRGELEELAQRVAAGLDRPFAIEGNRFTIGACIGVTRLEDETTSAECLLQRADHALQAAKRDGRRSYHWFDGSIARRTQQHNEIRADLAMAIVREELALHYQPIVDIAKRRVVGFEALLRWDHPVRGRISPADFIPVAEETGLILPISDWVLKTACLEATRWPEHLKVSVNLSTIQFKQGDPVHSVDRALAASGLQPQRLECEITESTIIQDIERTVAAVRELKARGVTVALDDFGTGYSSLNCLSMLPFDRIKIDRSFVTGTEAGKSIFAILETIATLGRALGVTTVLEGVETNDQLALAVFKGCSAVQGFLFSAPCAADRVLDVLADVDARATPYLDNIRIDASL